MLSFSIHSPHQSPSTYSIIHVWGSTNIFYSRAMCLPKALHSVELHTNCSREMVGRRVGVTPCMSVDLPTQSPGDSEAALPGTAAESLHLLRCSWTHRERSAPTEGSALTEGGLHPLHPGCFQPLADAGP